MDKTPIQIAMQQILDMRYEDDSDDRIITGINRTIDNCLDILDSLLPTERQFAETCFEAGRNSLNHVVCVNHRGDEYVEETENQSFSRFYKQYSND